jgi:hypothetical protein
MKISEDFVLRQVANTWVVLPLKADTVDFNGMVRLNDSGAMLWKLLEQGASREELLQAMTEQYNVSREQAAQDLDEFIGILKQVGCLV